MHAREDLISAIGLLRRIPPLSFLLTLGSPTTQTLFDKDLTSLRATFIRLSSGTNRQQVSTTGLFLTELYRLVWPTYKPAFLSGTSSSNMGRICGFLNPVFGTD